VNCFVGQNVRLDFLRARGSIVVNLQWPPLLPNFQIRNVETNFLRVYKKIQLFEKCFMRETERSTAVVFLEEGIVEACFSECGEFGVA